jgi:hypothetical protein
MIAGTNRGVSAPSGKDLALAKEATSRLLAYCQANDWAGYDPFDALNSRFFEAVPFLHFRLLRLVLTQVMKRSPINFRPLLLVPRTQNPKGLALFLAALLKLNRLGLLEQKQKELVPDLARKLEALRSPGPSYWCWGYSFPWQTRTVLVPRGAPNLVCTTFVASALLDLYDESGETRWLDMAVSAADYVLNELYWTDGGTVAGFGYPTPSSKSQVYNANFLGAALLCRVAFESGKERFLEPALKVARYSAAGQRADGSWHYSEAPTQRWIDNFHTGYNLCALRRIGDCAGTSEFEERVLRGLDYYRQHFFTEDGAPKYFHNRTYPLDVHSAAQSIITLLDLEHFHRDNSRLAHRVLRWTLTNLRAPCGCFFYHRNAWGTNKIHYMRWSQAWMLLALSVILGEGFDPAAEDHGTNHGNV